jgi:DNA-binding response OmpR family regulator/HPt (histidine-containing phosphotransfer) domain-containing protein
MRILLVEDDEVLRDLLIQRLSEQNYVIDATTDGLKGLDYAITYDYDLLILDVVLPELDGISLCQKLRSQGCQTPILLLTSQDTRSTKITGLDAGADDYVVKPFDEAELIARIRALLRRGSHNSLPILIWDDLWLNTSSKEVYYGEVALTLTAKEYALLEMMMRESHHVFSNEEILDSLWSSEEFPADATVRSHIRHLRHKLTAAGAPADLIATSHGRGYYLKSLPSDRDPLEPTAKIDVAPEMQVPEQEPVKKTSASLSSAQKQAQYEELLRQTWQDHRQTCLQKVQTLQAAIEDLSQATLTAPQQAEALRLAHTLAGTLGTLGFEEAMHLARALEQDLRLDAPRDRAIVHRLQTRVNALHHQVAQGTPGVPVTPRTPVTPSDSAPTDQAQSPHLLTRNPFTATQNIRVMWVDDDPIFLQTLPKQLRAYGFEVSTLDDPGQFWTVLECITPDVLVLDVQMPQINGFELCQGLRSISPWQKLPVLFLSMTGDTKTQHRAFAVGADDYLCKPITAKELGDRIHNRLQRIQAVKTLKY